MTTALHEEPQHIRALREANRIRLGRVAIKRQIEAGQLPIADVLESIPPELSTMPVGELLRCQMRWGRVRTRKFLGGLVIPENRTLGRLTLRQRALLMGAL